MGEVNQSSKVSLSPERRGSPLMFQLRCAKIMLLGFVRTVLTVHSSSKPFPPREKDVNGG